MSNQLPGCDSCYGNTPLFEGEKLHVNQVGRTLRIVDYPLDGDYKVKFDDGAFGFFPPTSLELIKSYTIGQLKSYEDFKKMIDELKAIVPLRNDVGVAPTNAVPKKAHDLINQTSKNIKQTDTVNSPSHYNQTKIEAIDIIEDVTAGYQSNVKYHIGNAIKYLIRAPFKNNTVEDLKKAAWYVNRAIEKLEGEQNGK